MLQLLGDLEEPIVAPAGGGAGLGLEGERHDRDVVDAAANNDRLWNPFRQIRDIGADLLVHAQKRGIFIGSNEETRRRDHGIVLSGRIDVFNAVDRLDDILERLGNEFDCVARFVTVGGDQYIDHGHADLRFFLARQREQRDAADNEGREEEERGQRRIDEGAGEMPGDAKLHGEVTTSPS